RPPTRPRPRPRRRTPPPIRRGRGSSPAARQPIATAHAPRLPRQPVADRIDRTAPVPRPSTRRHAARTKTSCSAPAPFTRVSPSPLEPARSPVVDQLRLLWNRPLRDGDRPRLFAIAAAL